MKDRLSAGHTQSIASLLQSTSQIMLGRVVALTNSDFRFKDEQASLRGVAGLLESSQSRTCFGILFGSYLAKLAVDNLLSCWGYFESSFSAQMFASQFLAVFSSNSYW